MCTLLSNLQNRSKRRGRQDWADRFEEAKEHIRFVVSLYLIQVQEGRLFLHEHPTGATNWDLEQIKELERKADVNLYTADLKFAKNRLSLL